MIPSINIQETHTHTHTYTGNHKHFPGKKDRKPSAVVSSLYWSEFKKTRPDLGEVNEAPMLQVEGSTLKLSISLNFVPRHLTHFTLKVKVSVAQLQCPTLCDPMDSNLPVSSIHGILHGSGQPFLSPGDLPDLGIEPGSPGHAGSLPSEAPRNTYP